jgi:NAD(P)H-hydrate epimerase
MRFVTSSQMRELDRRTIAERGVSGGVLMCRAGAAVARVVSRLAATRGTRRITIITGRGNNAGDAFVAARCLHAAGCSVDVFMTCLPAALRGDARVAWNDMHAAGVPHQVLATPEDWPASDEQAPLPGDPQVHSAGSLIHAAAWPRAACARLPLAGVVVDGLLGTGARGAPEGVIAAAVRWIREARRQALVVSIDLPSGLDADTGLIAAEAVCADVTVTFAHPKAGFLGDAAQDVLGHVVVADIGIPEDLIDVIAPPQAGAPRLIAVPELVALLPRRSRDAHKGLFGHVLVIGGSRSFAGAPALAALGALRAGAGLVTAAVPPESVRILAAHAPEIMVQPLDTPDGQITVAALAAWGRDLSAFDAVVVGPGMTPAPSTRDVLKWLLERYAGRVLLDADALNVMAGWQPPGPERIILTPHPGEAARLLGMTIDQVQQDRHTAACRLAAESGCVAVLKGAGTLVCAAHDEPWLNLTGNPGMATGGSGDVLAGVIAALWARGLTAMDAARLGVWLHGTAGDFAMWQVGQEALIATEIVRALPHAFALLREL